MPAAASTSDVWMPTRSKMIASSFISAMLMSRCVFSMTFAASATLIEGARWMPASMTAPYVDGHALEGGFVLAGRPPS